MRDDQIGGAIAIEVGNGDGARLVQLHRVELHVFRHIGPTRRAEVPQEAEFTTTVRLTRGNKIEPAVVVIIKRRNAPAARPAEIGKRYAHELLAIYVPPETHAGRAGVCKRHVHPAVFVEVKNGDADSRRKILLLEINSRQRSEFSFSRVQVDGRAVLPSGDNEINGAVVVEVAGHNACARGGDAERRFRGNIREGAVGVVAPQDVVRVSARSVHDIQIEVAVVVVIHERQANASLFAANSCGLRDVGEFPVALVVQQTDAIGEAHGQVGLAVVVEIARRAPQPCTCKL